MRHNYCLLAGILLLAGCSTFTPAPPAPPALHFTPSLAIQVKWQLELVDRTPPQYVTLTPAYLNGKLLIATPAGVVVARTATTGAVVWRTPLQQPVTTGLGVGNGLVIAATADAQLVALEENTGRLLWKAPLSNTAFAKPVVATTQVFVRTQDDRLYALDAHSGKVLWTYRQSVPDLILRAGGSPQVFDDYVIAGFANGALAILARQNGKVIWQQQLDSAFGVSDLENMSDIVDAPLVRNGIAYVAAYQGQLLALNLTTKQILWQHPLSADTDLAMDDQKIYAADTNGALWAFYHESGLIAWKQKALAGRQLTAPVLAGQQLVVGDAQGNLYWLATDDGHLLAQVALDTKGISATPVVVDQAVGVYTNAGKFILLQSAALPH